jgi:uncharacterized protein YjbI with pentapeptide repeats
MEEELMDLERRITEIRTALEAKKAKEVEFMQKLEKAQQGYIVLNVGGVRYTTSRATLARYPESMLESLVSGRFDLKPMADGSVFIDRDGTHFGVVLNAMRTGALMYPPGFADYKALAAEVEFYQLPFKVPHSRGNGPIMADFTRPKLCRLLSSARLVDLSGVRFCGLDLSRLRFFNSEGISATTGGFAVRFIGCDFAGCTFAQARCFSVNFRECLFVGAEFTGAVFDQCLMAGCQFDEADLSNAKFTKCDMKQASFVDATLSEAAITDCDLTGANLTRAVIDKTNFTGSALANANLKDVDTKTANWTKVTGLVTQ